MVCDVLEHAHTMLCRCSHRHIAVVEDDAVYVRHACVGNTSRRRLDEQAVYGVQVFDELVDSRLSADSSDMVPLVQGIEVGLECDAFTCNLPA